MVMDFFYLLLFALLHAMIHWSNAGNLHIGEALNSYSIPLFIPHDPSAKHAVKLNSWINNVNELQLYRKRRSSSTPTPLNINVTSLDDELLYKSELEGPWQSQILSATQVVFFLSQLLIASNQRDFSLQSSSSNIQYKYIRYPSSSQATMLQIANEAWSAFDQAHHNMNSIQISMQQIPVFIKEVLKILQSGSRYRIKHFLPGALNNIQLKRQNAMKVATETHLKFANLMLLIGEVVEASGLAETTSKEKLKETERQLAVTRKMLDEAMKMKELVQQEFQDVRSKTKKAVKDYSKALKKVQTAKKAVAQQFTRGILKFVVDIFTTGVKVLLLGPTIGFGSLLLSGKKDQSKNAFSNDHSPIGNAKYLAAMALERLRDGERRYDQRFEDFKQAQIQCSQLMVKIAALDFTKVDQQQIINVLHDILRILGDLREQWSKLILFFGRLEVLTTNKLDVVDSFIGDVWEAIGDPSLLQTDAQLFKGLLKTQAIRAVDKSIYLIFLMSGTYVDVSRQYIVSQVAGLSKLLAAVTGEERNRLKDELFRTTRSAQDQITSFVDERKRQYHTIIEQQKMELDTFMKNLDEITSDDQALIESDKGMEGLGDS